ncbi:cyclopropane-fatty-acyl-phospholipid synthase [Leptospira broomii serovar Hurstbridge str. 5399]|uniref:Cyclopropane-fatty-acyl-phospholipid synthase n=1 Tax=Leptospira broomii serovar Hurstbridge str. 5399 TaxID=1049789 RepID=T0FBF3_9LEPT|nr:cyclopropane fatty acyl phospholipid synthase [Leptospira broomii]EQA44912.1 cyclopropane-fatty-acyl-phospholipid synthase [Leptospira broomii serovar Hurstbridge str. 5399]
MRSAIRSKVENLFSGAGISFGGNSPWDIKIRDEAFYERLIAKGSLGFGEAYMDGWFESEQLDQTVYRIVKAGLENAGGKSWRDILLLVLSRLINQQNKSRAFEVGERHYDLGNDLFQEMLDPELVYSCAYWKNAANLAEAQKNKLDLICRKIGLKSGMKVLDIGCGWGGFARHAARNYGAEVVGISVSKEQLALANDLSKGLKIEFRLQDYRDVNESFDRIVSVGQMEHVGFKNYRTYMKLVYKCLKDEGLFLLHTIGSNDTARVGDAWIEKYIFPNSLLPSLAQLTSASENLFVLEDLQNFGSDYDRTLMAWYHNFERSWKKIGSKYGERFHKMWKFYLLACAGAFRARKLQLWQFVFTKGVDGVYEAAR